MSMSPHRFTFARWVVAAAVATLPLAAFAWGSQAGDNGRQPVGADTDSPRQAIPNETTNYPPIDYESGTAYYAATTAYDRALYYCDQRPVEQRDACRDTAAARYGYPQGSERRPAFVETYPPYMTYRYSSPSPVYRGTGPAPEYYASSSPRVYWSEGMAEVDRCAPNYGAGSECLHGGVAGD